MLIFKLLDEQKEALKEKDGEVVDLRRRMEELSAAEKAATEENSQLRADLDHQAVVRSNWEERLEQLRGELEKGSDVLKRDSDMKQKKLALQTAQRELEETRQRAEGAEATLRSKWNAFEKAKECLEDDLSRPLITQDKAEVREQATIDQSQWAMKVFKFKKYKKWV